MVIAAFEGWNDAGEAATAAVDHLAAVWDAEAIAALDPEDYYDFQVNRPQVVLRRRAPPDPLAHHPDPRRPRHRARTRDVVLVQGIEPSIRWRAFTIELMEFAQAARRLDRSCTLGALLADVPHTRPIPVTATSDDDDVIHRLDLEPSRYEGPTGIVGVLCRRRHPGRAAVALAAGRPSRTTPGTRPRPRPPSRLLGSSRSCSTRPSRSATCRSGAKAWERGINELAETDDEVAEYVQSLEEAQDTADLPEASGDAIAREFERYLRRRGDEGTPAPA